MKVTYDATTDALTVILRDGAQVAESDEDEPGAIFGLRRTRQLDLPGSP
jgi:uncharacterized protein YuzE